MTGTSARRGLRFFNEEAGTSHKQANPTEDADGTSGLDVNPSSAATDTLPAIRVLAPSAARQRKKQRVPGGGPATFKPIVPDYDSEDEIIVRMKQAAYSDRDIVRRLVDEGRTKYDPKSITSRWQRLRRCLQNAEDELLDAELTDWYLEDDELLEQAYERATAKIQEELAKVRDKLFVYVARDLNKHASRPRFSANACRVRYEAKVAGTARVPPELDPDPEARAQERAERLQTRMLQAQQETTAKNEAANKATAKQKQLEKSKISRQKRKADELARAREKEEDAEFKRAKAAAAEESRKQREESQAYVRAFGQYNLRKAYAEKMLRQKLLKEATVRDRKKSKFSLQFPPPADDPASGTASITTRPTGIPRTSSIGTRSSLSRRSGKARDNIFDFVTEELGLDSRKERLAATPAISSAAVPSTTPAAPPVPVVVANPYGEDPRTYCVMAELYDIMRKRGMVLRRMKEVKEVVLSRINDDDATMTDLALETLLRERKLATDGTRAQLIRRLQEDEGGSSAAFKRIYGPQQPVAVVAMANAAASAAATAPAVPSATTMANPATTGVPSVAGAPGLPDATTAPGVISLPTATGLAAAPIPPAAPVSTSRFTALPPSAAGTKRYNARERTRQLAEEAQQTISTSPVAAAAAIADAEAAFDRLQLELAAYNRAPPKTFRRAKKPSVAVRGQLGQASTSAANNGDGDDEEEDAEGEYLGVSNARGY